MTGRTLAEIEAEIEALAVTGARLYVRCARTGLIPVPVGGERFATRQAAVEAARLAREYRDTLRRYDPQLPYYDLIVCDDSWTRYSPEQRQQEFSDDCESDTSITGTSRFSPETDTQSLVEYCHEIAGTVFTTLSRRDFGELEEDIMETYLELADTATDRDEVCLRILEYMVDEFDQRLTPSEQATILEAAAERLSPISRYGDPLQVVFSHLCTTSIIADYSLNPDSVDLVEGARTWQVTLAGYALRSDGRRLPTLPIALDLRRQRPTMPLLLTQACPIDDQTWQLQLVANTSDEPESCVSVPEVRG